MDEAQNYFKNYKVEVENQLEKKLKRFRSIDVKSISLMGLTYSM
jgi:hypothetical protein